MSESPSSLTGTGAACTEKPKVVKGEKNNMMFVFVGQFQRSWRLLRGRLSPSCAMEKWSSWRVLKTSGGRKMDKSFCCTLMKTEQWLLRKHQPADFWYQKAFRMVISPYTSHRFSSAVWCGILSVCLPQRGSRRRTSSCFTESGRQVSLVWKLLQSRKT